MSIRLGRMIDRIFFGGGRAEVASCATGPHVSLHARPCVEDRARYDSGTSVYHH
jgi:hypothetical protein